MYPQPDLSLIARQSTSVYVHLPWCRARCGYCAFYSEPLGDGARVDPVVKQILSLLRRRLAALENPTVDTVYVGGGTPTILPRQQLQRLLAGIAETTKLTTEFTIEANPHTVTTRLLEDLRESGVTRISVGVQSFQPRLLNLIRRSCRDPAMTNHALSLLAGFGHLQFSLDLIGGILDMSLLEAVDDAERACAANPDHISLYDLTIEPSTLLERSLRARPRLVNPNRSAEVLSAARAVLQRHGYHRYEISNYSLTGRECRHNRRYWQMEPFIGVGPSSVSSIPHAGGGMARYTDPPDIDRFIDMDNLWGEFESVDLQSTGFEMLMLGLRTDQGVSLAEVESRLGADRSVVMQAVIARWIADGLAFPPAAGELVMTDTGLDQLDSCLRSLADEWRHA